MCCDTRLLLSFVLISDRHCAIYLICYRDNPLYTDTRCNDKNRYNDTLTVTKPSLKRQQIVTNYARISYLYFIETYILDIFRIALLRRF